MPEFSVFKIFQIFGIVSSWATKAFADGVVTLSEAVELAISLCAILGIPTKLDLPGAPEEAEASLSADDQGTDTLERAGQKIPLHGPPDETGSAL